MYVHSPIGCLFSSTLRWLTSHQSNKKVFNKITYLRLESCFNLILLVQKLLMNLMISLVFSELTSISCLCLRSFSRKGILHRSDMMVEGIFFLTDNIPDICRADSPGVEASFCLDVDQVNARGGELVHASHVGNQSHLLTQTLQKRTEEIGISADQLRANRFVTS